MTLIKLESGGSLVIESKSGRVILHHTDNASAFELTANEARELIVALSFAVMDATVVTYGARA